MNKELFRELRVFYYENSYLPHGWEHYTGQVSYICAGQYPDKLEHSWCIQQQYRIFRNHKPVYNLRTRATSHYGPVGQRKLDVNPFFIDRCAMHGCNAPAMHRYHGKTYCHSGATHMQRLNAKIQAFRMAKVADNLSQIIMLGESSGEGKEV